MIIVKIIGGLGNQMFQYAAGRRLAYVLGVKLKFDISEFGQYKSRDYALDVFDIQGEVATQDEVCEITGQSKGFFRKITSRVCQSPPKLSHAYIKERHFHFDPEVMNLSDGVYLDGYWQSDKYFKEIEETIHKEFTVKTPQKGKNEELARIIRSCESVSLHIRRCDFISNPTINQVHGVCDLDYYDRCILQIEKKVSKPHLFVFSDDPDWACENLKVTHPIVFITHNNSEHAYEDLRLMSQCKHNIIANSTFSWWGAWLNKNQNKIVIAPTKWFNDASFNTKDLIPAGWIKI